MSDTLQMSLEKILEEIIERSGCANLPEETRANFEDQIRNLLLQRLVNIALANLSDAEAAELIEKTENAESPEVSIEYLAEIFSRNNDAENILLEEAKYLEAELVNS
ncbi:MAG: hypothetical protein WC304_03605 [Candidatus Gracilibacteria bacterium]|jgi:hypothetical protein